MDALIAEGFDQGLGGPVERFERIHSSHCFGEKAARYGFSAGLFREPKQCPAAVFRIGIGQVFSCSNTAEGYCDPDVVGERPWRQFVGLSEYKCRGRRSGSKQ